MEPAQKSDSCQLRLEQTQKHPFPTDMLWLFFFDSHAIQNSPRPQEHLSSLSQSTSCWNLNRKSRFIALITCEWQLYPQGSMGATLIGPSEPNFFGSVKLAPIKCEKSFVPRHMKSDEGPFWNSTIWGPPPSCRQALRGLFCACYANSKVQKPPSQLLFSLPSIIMTITSNEPWNTETHKTDPNPPITNHKPWPFEPVKVKFCFLGGPLRWLTAAKNAIVSWLLNFTIRVFVKSAVKCKQKFDCLVNEVLYIKQFKTGGDKTRNMEHPGTSRKMKKWKYIFMKKQSIN